MVVNIQLFAAADAESVCQLGADTARYGDPVEHILDDRRLFIDIFMRPYITRYPDTCWVATDSGHVVGYLTGCMDTASYQSVFYRAVFKAVGRMLLARYRMGRRTFRAGIGFVRDLLARHPAPDLTLYPAHLHINLAASHRGQGIGRQLMTTYLDHCRAYSVPGIHLSTSEKNVAAVHLYHKLGFAVLHRYRSFYQSSVSREPVDTFIMGLSLK